MTILISEDGLAIQKRSLQERASVLRVSEDEWLRGLAQGFKNKISGLLETFAALEVPVSERERVDQVILNLQADFKRLDDPKYALEYRQQQLQEFYQQLVTKFGGWLNSSSDAQAMLDEAHLHRIEDQLGFPPTGSLPDRCVRIARAVEVVSPLNASFNAETSKLVPAIWIFSGIPDCFFAASSLIVAHSVEERKGGIVVRDLRSYPEDFEWAVGKLREIIEAAVGKHIHFPRAVVNPSKTLLRALEYAIYEGAMALVVFHELGHLLLPHAETPHAEEHKCDAFATHLLISSRDPGLICGLYTGDMLCDAISAESEGWLSTLVQPWLSDDDRTHPRRPFRSHRIATLVEMGGMMPTGPLDALLAIPTRLMEEETFEHLTRWDVFMRLEQHFSNLPEGYLTEEIRNEIPAGIGSTVRLPRLSESTDVTLQAEGKDMRARIVAFDLPNAVVLANRIINHQLIERPDVSEKEKRIAMDRSLREAVGIALECLAVLVKKPNPPSSATDVLYSLMRAKKLRIKLVNLVPDSGSRNTLEEALEILEDLGCVLVDRKFVSLKQVINLRLIHKPRYD